MKRESRLDGYILKWDVNIRCIATVSLPYLLTDEWKQNCVVVCSDLQNNFWETLISLQRRSQMTKCGFMIETLNQSNTLLKEVIICKSKTSQIDLYQWEEHDYLLEFVHPIHLTAFFNIHEIVCRIFDHTYKPQTSISVHVFSSIYGKDVLRMDHWVLGSLSQSCFYFCVCLCISIWLKMACLFNNRIQEQTQTTLPKFKDFHGCFQPRYQVAKKLLWRRLHRLVNTIIGKDKCIPDIISSLHIATPS